MTTCFAFLLRVLSPAKAQVGGARLHCLGLDTQH